jgi:hypothetical protein
VNWFDYDYNEPKGFWRWIELPIRFVLAGLAAIGMVAWGLIVGVASIVGIVWFILHLLFGL